MTPITYEEAASLLGKTEGTLQHAAVRGVFSKLPRVGIRQPLIKEQVLLFVGKNRLSLNSLNNEERKLWAELDAAAKNTTSSPAPAPVLPPAPPVQVGPLNWFGMPDRDTLAYLNETGASLVASTPAGAVSFPSALSGEQDSENEYPVLSDGVLIAILIGLALLFLMYAFSKVNEKKLAEARKIAERTIQDIGLDKGDLLEDTAGSMEILRSHPRELETLKYILERENLIPAA